MNGLTPRMSELRNFIVAHEHRTGHAPSYEEMARGLGTSKSNAHRLASCLQERGYIRRVPRTSRSITARPEPAQSLAVAREHVAYCINAGMGLRQILEAIFNHAPQSVSMVTAIGQVAAAWEHMHEERQ